ncbi:MAG: class I SAM-dependent methyltransferase [Flavobacteriaceae bacterium]
MSGRPGEGGFDARRAAARQRLDTLPGNDDPADPERRRWFEAVYDTAGDDPAAIPWADLAPHPLLVEWARGREHAPGTAIDVGCGLGDNAEFVASLGYDSWAFDLSEKAVGWARRRFPDSAVDYVAADLFDMPAWWARAFNLVTECYTLQALAERPRRRAMKQIASLVAPRGTLVVIARLREAGPAGDGPPWPIAPEELSVLERAGLEPLGLDRRTPEGEKPHLVATYRRPAG